MNFHFAELTFKGFPIAEFTLLGRCKSGQNDSFAEAIGELFEPCLELVCFVYYEHCAAYPYGY
jgi:hypothetical protein